MKLVLRRVRFMPEVFEPGVLYVSEEFGTAIHLCACGCGSKVNTPLGPTDWSFTDTALGPSLYPSIGNWQLPCRSHYWIEEGLVVWSGDWTPAQVTAGRAAERGRAEDYYRTQGRPGCFRRFAQWGSRLVEWLWGR